MKTFNVGVVQKQAGGFGFMHQVVTQKMILLYWHSSSWVKLCLFRLQTADCTTHTHTHNHSIVNFTVSHKNEIVILIILYHHWQMQRQFSHLWNIMYCIMGVQTKSSVHAKDTFFVVVLLWEILRKYYITLKKILTLKKRPTVNIVQFTVGRVWYWTRLYWTT